MATFLEFLKEIGKMEITAKVLLVEQKPIKTGNNIGQPYWVLTLDNGQKVTVFSQTLIGKIQQGGEYQLSITTKGQYINLDNVLPIIQYGTPVGQAPMSASAPGTPGEPGNPDPNMDVMTGETTLPIPTTPVTYIPIPRSKNEAGMSRGGALKVAGRLVSSAITSGQLKVGDLIELLDVVNNVVIPIAERMDKFSDTGE